MSGGVQCPMSGEDPIPGLGGTPSQVRGATPSHVWGGTPSQVWGVPHLRSRGLPGVPPLPDLGWGTPLPSRPGRGTLPRNVNRQTPVKTVPSRYTPWMFV